MVKRAAGVGALRGQLTRPRSTSTSSAQAPTPAANVVGVLRAGAADRLPGAVLVGAHYDHLGHGGAGSLAPDSHEVHNGADDNASGTAALLEVARQLAGAARHACGATSTWSPSPARRRASLGSTAFTRQPPAGLKIADLVAMLNMDMVGRLRGNRVTVLGGESAAEWKEIVPPLCDRERLACSLSGDGYGPSDHSPFYAAGVPVLHFFTGAHEDYHKPSDDADTHQRRGRRPRRRPGGGRRRRSSPTAPSAPPTRARRRPRRSGDVALLRRLARHRARLRRRRPARACCWPACGRAAPPRQARPPRAATSWSSSPARPIRDINDFMYVLQRAEARREGHGRGGTATAKRVTLEVTFGTSGTLRK